MDTDRIRKLIQLSSELGGLPVVESLGIPKDAIMIVVGSEVYDLLKATNNECTVEANTNE